MKRGYIFIALLFLWSFTGAAQAQTIINCASGFNNKASGPCSTSGETAQLWLENQATLSGTSIELLNSGVHIANNFWVNTPANIQAFTTTFSFHADCSANPTACGFGWGFMGIGNDATNPACPPIGASCSHYSDGSTTSFSWDSGCTATSSLDNNANCYGTNLFLVKMDLCQLSFTTCGQSLTDYFQASSLPGKVASVGSDGGGAFITLVSPLSTLPPNGATVADITTQSSATTFIVTGSTTSKLYLASTSGYSVNNLITVGNTIGGTWPHSANDQSMAAAGINLASTHEFTVTIHYNDSTVGMGLMSETVTDQITSATFTHTYSTDSQGNAINIPGVMAGATTAFIGFGGSTAQATMTVYIDGWTYTVESPPGATPTRS
jgi:hypothetical protein